jgi:hypothetical protein
MDIFLALNCFVYEIVHIIIFKWRAEKSCWKLEIVKENWLATSSSLKVASKEQDEVAWDFNQFFSHN